MLTCGFPRNLGGPLDSIRVPERRTGGHLRSFLDRRVRDGVLRRAIDKWLKVGLLEEGMLMHPDSGTPQGGVISPLLANIYLHEVLDRWFYETVQPRLGGKAVLVRYADDFVIILLLESDTRFRGLRSFTQSIVAQQTREPRSRMRESRTSGSARGTGGSPMMDSKRARRRKRRTQPRVPSTDDLPAPIPTELGARGEPDGSRDGVFAEYGSDRRLRYSGVPCGGARIL
jgi:hypothetical protein